MSHKTAVLFVTTGSPARPEAPAVRDYLERFLSDKRVVDLPRWKWMPILHLFILPNRPKRSAERYRQVWTDAGSPLIVGTEEQVARVRELLVARGYDGIETAFCCLYSAPEIEDVLHDLLDVKRCDRLVVVPLYAQYASVTNGTLGVQVLEAVSRRVRVPSIAFVDSYWDESRYLDALAESVRRSAWTWVDDGRHRLVFTFHSTLVQDIEHGDVYRDQAEGTAREVAERLGVPERGWCVGYQSVFDKRPWLGPLTEEELIPRLADEGVTDLAVVAPGFACECLETHFDIDVDQRRAFESRVPGGTFTYVPCLGSDPLFIEALADVVEKRLVR